MGQKICNLREQLKHPPTSNFDNNRNVKVCFSRYRHTLNMRYKRNEPWTFYLFIKAIQLHSPFSAISWLIWIFIYVVMLVGVLIITSHSYSVPCLYSLYCQICKCLCLALRGWQMTTMALLHQDILGHSRIHQVGKAETLTLIRSLFNPN